MGIELGIDLHAICRGDIVPFGPGVQELEQIEDYRAVTRTTD
jgi:hypothetical protein